MNIKPIKSNKAVIKHIKASFQSKKFKGGAYATAISVIVLILLLLVNVFTSELDLKIDLSSENMYTITEESKDFVKKIKDDITVYYLAKSGEEDKTFTEIVEKYVGLSSYLKLEYKDPILYPKFASTYVEDEINTNSILVVNHTNGRGKYIDSSELTVTEYDYNYNMTYESGIDVEGQLTKAISYLTTDVLPIVYVVEGHGETEIQATLLTSLSKANVTTNSLATLKVEEIPSDCSLLFINGPKTDYSEDEIAMIKEYLAAGGDAIILVDYNAEGLTNFNSLLNYYGVSLVDGIVLEGNNKYFMGQYPNNLLPSINSHSITQGLISDKKSVVIPAAKGIMELEQKRSTIVVEPLFTTSEDAYSKINVESTTLQKEEEDIIGPFHLGVAITENYNTIETNLVVYGSAYVIDESMLSYPSLGNLSLILSSITFLVDMEEAISIPAKSLVQEYITLTSAQVNLWSTIVIIIIPVIILGIGGFVCIKRRRK